MLEKLNIHQDISLVPRPFLSPGTRNQGPGTRDQGPGTMDQGPGTKDQGPGTRDQGPGTRDQGPRTRDQGPGTKDQGPRSQGPGTKDQGPRTKDQGLAEKLKFSRPSLLVFAYCKRSKTGDRNGLGTRLMSWWMFNFSSKDRLPLLVKIDV